MGGEGRMMARYRGGGMGGEARMMARYRGGGRGGENDGEV